MPKSCAARQCCNRYSNRRKQLTFHRFPFSRPELLKEWVLNIGRGNFQPKQHTVICSEHFRPECFSAFGNRKNLKHNAVPTEFAFQDARQVSYTLTGPNISHCPQQLPVSQLVREDTDAAGKGGHADSEKEKVFPEAEAREHGPERKTDTALEGLQRPPSARDPVGQVLPCRPEAAEAPAQPASPPQPSDHSYALLDLDALKKKLFVTLKENEKLRKRLKAQRLVMRRLCRRLRARGAGQPGPGQGPSQSSRAEPSSPAFSSSLGGGPRFGGAGHEPFRPADDSGSEACR